MISVIGARRSALVGVGRRTLLQAGGVGLLGLSTTPPASPEDLAATIYYALGIDHRQRINDQLGRSHAVVEGGRVLHELFGA